MEKCNAKRKDFTSTSSSAHLLRQHRQCRSCDLLTEIQSAILAALSDRPARRSQECRVFRSLADDVFSGISAKALRAHARIGDNGYNSTFRAVVGFPLGSFMREIRLQTAALVLQLCPRLPIWRVAQSVGYASPSSFTHAFAKRFGKPPRVFRQESAPESIDPVSLILYNEASMK